MAKHCFREETEVSFYGIKPPGKSPVLLRNMGILSPFNGRAFPCDAVCFMSPARSERLPSTNVIRPILTSVSLSMSGYIYSPVIYQQLYTALQALCSRVPMHGPHESARISALGTTIAVGSAVVIIAAIIGNHSEQAGMQTSLRRDSGDVRAQGCLLNHRNLWFVSSQGIALKDL